MSFAELRKRIDRLIWHSDRRKMPRWQSESLFMLQVVLATVREFVGGLPTLRAMGLVYTTLLSIVPLLAFSFSVLKGFGVHNNLEPMLLAFLEPLGERGAELARTTVGFVDNMRVGVLGALGLAMLIYTVVSLLKKIEMAFNYTWRVTEYRRMTQRISDYLSVALVGPVLIFSALGLTATVGRLEAVVWLQSLPGVAFTLEFIGRLVPYLLVIAAFTFIYILVPNTKVRYRSALTGAIIAGVLWASMSWAFSTFVVASTRQTAIYSSLAILFIFMIWLYLNWLIVLIGATIAYYHQHPERVSVRQQVLRRSCRLREKLALLIMLRVGQSFYEGGRRWTPERLARDLDVSVDAVTLVLRGLEQHDLVTATREKSAGLMPGRSLDRITVHEILEAIRAAEETRYLSAGELKSAAAVDEVVERLSAAMAAAVANLTLHDLVAVETRPSQAGEGRTTAIG